MTRLVVTGGREFYDDGLMNAVMDSLLEDWGITEIAHGAQQAWMPLTNRWRGADHYVGLWAESRGVPCQEFPVNDAEWRRYGKAAGPIRNRRMLDEFQPDRVLAFPGGKGTKDCATAAMQRGLDVFRARRTDGLPDVMQVSAPHLF